MAAARFYSVDEALNLIFNDEDSEGEQFESEESSDDYEEESFQSGEDGEMESSDTNEGKLCSEFTLDILLMSNECQIIVCASFLRSKYHWILMFTIAFCLWFSKELLQDKISFVFIVICANFKRYIFSVSTTC